MLAGHRCSLPTPHKLQGLSIQEAPGLAWDKIAWTYYHPKAYIVNFGFYPNPVDAALLVPLASMLFDKR
jgi:hypothetical protein